MVETASRWSPPQHRAGARRARPRGPAGRVDHPVAGYDNRARADPPRQREELAAIDYNIVRLERSLARYDKATPFEPVKSATASRTSSTTTGACSRCRSKATSARTRCARGSCRRSPRSSPTCTRTWRSPAPSSRPDRARAGRRPPDGHGPERRREPQPRRAAGRDRARHRLQDGGPVDEYYLGRVRVGQTATARSPAASFRSRSSASIRR